MTIHTPVGPKAKYKAVIHTALHNGESRVFYTKRINDKVKVVKTKGKHLGTYEVTGYKTLSNVVVALKNCIPVYLDEQVEYMGEPCEHKLGVQGAVVGRELTPKYTVEAVREVVAKRCGMSWAELVDILEAA